MNDQEILISERHHQAADRERKEIPPFLHSCA